jgi:hypothetical protein
MMYSVMRKENEEILLDLLPLVRFDSFQLICNEQEARWHINNPQFHMEITQKLFHKY